VNTKNKDVFYKVMKNIQGSLENIMIYYKNSRPKKVTIGEFVRNQKIQGIGEEILDEPFENLPIDCIVDLYELIEMSTFYQVSFLLDPGYSSEDLTEPEKKRVEEIIQRMKDGGNEFLPTYNDFRVALYRFISRSLLLMEKDPKLILTDFLANSAFLWPIDVDIYNFLDQDWHEAFRFSLKKTGKLMQLVPPPKFEDEVRMEKLLQMEKEKMANGKQDAKRDTTLDFSKSFKPTFKTNVGGTHKVGRRRL